MLLQACIAATIEVESPYHAPRMDGLVTESVCAAQSIFIVFFVKPFIYGFAYGRRPISFETK